MKKVLALTLALIMCIGLAACGASAPAEKPAETPAEAPAEAPAEEAVSYELSKPVSLRVSSQEVGTACYQYISAMTNVWQDNLPDKSLVDILVTSPGALGAPYILAKGDCDIIMSNSVPAHLAITTGYGEYTAVDNVRALAGGIGKDFMIVVFTQSFVDRTGYTSLEDVIADKYPLRVATKSAGSNGLLTAEALLACLGTTFDEIVSWGGEWTPTNSTGYADMLKDDKADAIICHIGAGQAQMTELCMTTDIFFPQLTDETLKKICDDYGFDYITMEAGTFNGQEEDILTVGTQQVILVRADMDDAVAYNLTKALCENTDTLVAAVAAMQDFNPNISWKESLCGVPVHPGALAYYEEAGLVS